MKQTDRVKFCNCCRKQKYSHEQGTICGLTDKKADFEGHCPHFEDDGSYALSKARKDDFWTILFMIFAGLTCLTSAEDVIKLDFSTVGVYHLYGICFYSFKSILSAYVIFALLTKQRSVIYWCITLPALTIYECLFVILHGLANLDVMTTFFDCLPTIVANVLWIAYFIKSEFIATKYKPKEVDYKKDKYILTTIFVILLVVYILGVLL